MNNQSIAIEFPLRGVWISPNNPGIKVPSHGTHLFGETYAFDFVKVDEKGKSNKFYKSTLLEYLLNGIPLDNCYGWGADIYSPCDGEIVKVEDGIMERKKVSLVNDLIYMKKVSKMANRGRAKYTDLAGNYVIMKCATGVYAVFAHLQMGSTLVKTGQIVERGEIIGRVGHSGNSTAPHLHFQLMDNVEAEIAHGIPCVFTEFEELRDGEWIKIANGIPRKGRIRYMKY